MKSYFIFSLLVLASLAMQAQDELVIKGTKKITKKLTPQQVIDSLEARFPNAKSVNYYQVSATAAKNGWEVTEEDNLEPGSEVEYYTLSFKRDDFQYYRLYKPDGTLVMSKQEQKDVALPEPVVTSIRSIAKDYPGYKLKSKTYYKRSNYEKNKEYYEVVATNGKEDKRLYFAPDGTLMKTKG